MDIDRSVISPSVLNPDWNDPTKFTYNPDFCLGADADYFLSALTSAAFDDDPGRVSEELQGQSNVAQSVANASGENPSKRLKLSLSRERNRVRKFALLSLRCKT